MIVRVFDKATDPNSYTDHEVSCAAEWVLAFAKDNPDTTIAIYAYSVAEENDITRDEDALLDESIEYVEVLLSPGEAITAVYVIGALLAAASVAMALMTKKKAAAADNVDRGQTSDNNSLSDRTNKARYLERVEDIVGTVLSVPAMIAPTYTKIDNNKQVRYEVGLYSIGRGYYDISDTKEGDTFLSNISGASAKFYEPFNSPNEGASPYLTIGDTSWSIPLLQARRAEQFDSTVLKAPNQVQLPSALRPYRFNEPGNDQSPIYSSITQTGDNSDMANFSELFHIGDTVVVSGATTPGRPETSSIISQANGDTDQFILAAPNTGILVGDSVVVTGYLAEGLNGTYTVTAISGTAVTVSPVFSVNSTNSGTMTRAATPAVPSQYNGSYEVLEVMDSGIVINNTSWVGDATQTASIQIQGASEWTDWAILPDARLSGIIANFTADAGMYRDSVDDGIAYVSTGADMQAQFVDPITLEPIGLASTHSVIVSGATKGFRGYCLDMQGLETGPRRIRFRRTNNYDYGSSDVIQDEITLESVFACSTILQSNFGDLTIVHTKTEYTRQAAALGERKLNMIVSRKMPVYDAVSKTWSGVMGAGGHHDSGVIHPARDVKNIIPFVYADAYIGNRPLAEIDMDSLVAATDILYSIHPDLPTCDYTFDDSEMTVEDHIALIAEAGNMQAYRSYGKLRFEPDIRKTSPTMLFTHRNKKPKSDVITRAFHADGYDGVEYNYVSPTSVGSPYRTETIVLPQDGNYTKLKPFETSGVYGFQKAWLMANREYRKLTMMRQRIEFSATQDARMLAPDMLIAVVDNTKYFSEDGEVVAQAGLTLTLSQPVTFVSGQTHTLVLIKRDGSLQSVVVTPGANNKEVVMANAPAEAIVTEYGEDGVRTIFSFAPENARASQLYRVETIDMSDPLYVKITGYLDDPAFYDADYQSIPGEESVINNY